VKASNQEESKAKSDRAENQHDEHGGDNCEFDRRGAVLVSM